MSRRRLNINLGLKRTKKPLYPSESGYVAEMQQQSKQLTDALLNIIEQFRDISEDIMLEALQPTFKKALEYTPKDTGELKNSGYLEKNSFRGKPRVEMGFAKGGTPRYAVYVHEVPYFHKHPTRYKFLESALKEDLSGIFQRLSALYGNYMKG